MNIMPQILITKASGAREPFSREKLRRSLERSGAPVDVIDSTVRQIEDSLRPGISTHQVYQLAFGLLKKHNRPEAARYSLKRAVAEMGPTGHPFEKLIGEVLKTQGYDVKVAEMVKGHCVTHEVDVVAERQGRRLMVECKFHNGAGIKSDVKVVLYVWARFEDIRRAWQKLDVQGDYFNQAWLATNTKLTSDAIQYAECMGLHAVSWEYPPGESLPVLIERAGLHPITALTGLTGPEKRQLTAKGIILCRELNGSALAEIGISKRKVEAIMKELEELCRKL